eukprot:52682_1
MSVQLNTLTFNTLEITASTAALAFTIFAFYYQSIYVFELKAKKKFRCYSTAFLALLLIPFGMIFVSIELISHILHPHITENYTICMLYYVIATGSMTILKLCSYFALCTRVIESYSDTGIYSQTFLKIWQCYLIIGTATTSLIAFTYFEFDISHNLCDKIYPLWVIAVFGTHEFICFIVNIILFTKPLCQLTKMVDIMKEAQNGKKQNSSNNEIKYLIRKTSILGILAVLTSMFAINMISVINITEFWMSLDIIATSTCIILLFKRNQPIFECLCGCLMGKLANSEITQMEKCVFGCNTLLMLSKLRKINNDEQKLRNAMDSHNTTGTGGSNDAPQPATPIDSMSSPDSEITMAATSNTMAVIIH